MKTTKTINLSETVVLSCNGLQFIFHSSHICQNQDLQPSSFPFRLINSSERRRTFLLFIFIKSVLLDAFFLFVLLISDCYLKEIFGGFVNKPYITLLDLIIIIFVNIRFIDIFRTRNPTL